MSKEVMPLTIGERLKALRNEAGVQQAAVQQATGISRSSLSQYENGMRPPLDACIALARFYRVPLDYLCCLSNDRTAIAAGSLDDHLAQLSELAPGSISREAILQYCKAAADYVRAGEPCGSSPLEAAAGCLNGLAYAMRAGAKNDLSGVLAGTDAAIGAALTVHKMPGELLKRGE